MWPSGPCRKSAADNLGVMVPLPRRSEPSSMSGGAGPVASVVLVEDERALVERIRGGDVGAFEQLFRTYYEPLAAFALIYVASPVAAEEVAQDVLVRVWERRDRWVVAGNLRGYLYSAARNRAIDHVRRERLAARRERDMAPEGAARAMAEDAEGREADHAVRVRELEGAVARAIAALPARCRETVLLRWQHDLTRAETAVALGVTVKAVEAQMTRALKALRISLAEFF